VVRGTAPITVSGNGSVQQPYEIGLSMEGQTGCKAIVACVGKEGLGPGLVFDEGTGTIQVKLSTDSGQTARFGSDGGILVTTGGPPIPETCLHGIDSLPEAPGVVGATSLAGLHHPFSSPYGVDYCLAHQVHLIHFQVATSADDVGVVADYWDDHMSGGRSSIFRSQDIRQLSASTIQSCYNFAGAVNDPVAYVRPDTEDPDTREDRGGGWWGWLAARYYQPLLVDFLARINGKAVALLACAPQPGEAYGREATHIRGAIRGVLEYCAQNWALIGVAEIENAVTVINAGLTPILTPDGPVALGTWGTAELPYPVADVQDAGVEWMLLSDFYADEVFTAYAEAGISVLMLGNSRHEQRARVERLGLRGALALDPVYYRGMGGDYGYRAEVDPWEHRRPGVGQLTFRTDQQNLVSPAGLARGRPHPREQGLILPPNFGNGIGRPAVLCGWLCPLPDAEDYTITWEMRWNTLAQESDSRARMGLLFGAETDREPYGWPQGDEEKNPRRMPEGQQTLYRAYQRQNGEIGLAKWANQDDSLTELDTRDTPAIAADVWNSYTLRVTPDQITFTRELADGTRFSVSTGDTQYRGGYVWIEKEETFSGQPENVFEGMFRNVSYQEGAS